MNDNFNLTDYLSEGIKNVASDIVRASFKNPKETAYMVKYVLACKKAEKKRESFAAIGENIPAFLIASITSRCNLFCKGCFARANKSCGEGLKKNELDPEKWESIFKEARELGICFILLIGGETLVRRDVIEKAAEIKEIMFPIFTNGTMLKEDYINLFDNNRNLVPMLSIEGNKKETDARRGSGTYDILMNAMDKFSEKGVLFGASITVTTENIMTVTGSSFFGSLYDKGCRGVIFIEYVPVTEATQCLAPGDKERKILKDAEENLRNEYKDAVILSFPGDEKDSGGCLAAGRGFFHINVEGSAEPCPFSPYSDTSLKNHTLREALNSPLFKELDEKGMLLGEHKGGCLLFKEREEVKKLVK